MTIPLARQDAVRSAALAWVHQVSFDGTAPVTRDQLTNDYIFDGSRFPLVDAGRGSVASRPVGTLPSR